MKRVDILRAALAFAHGAALGAILLWPGLMMAEHEVFGSWWLMGAFTVQALLSLVSPKTPSAKVAPVTTALIFGAGICAVLGAGAWYLQDRIVWAAVQLNSLLMIAVVGGVIAIILMFVVMDRIRKAGERRELRERGEMT